MTYKFDPEKSLVHTRIFLCSRELVWKAWSDAALLTRWWGPDGFTSTFHEFDFRPGGEWKFILHGPTGIDYKNESRFIEIVENEKIVFEHLSTHYFTITALFEEVNEGTKMTWVMGFETPEECARMKPYVSEPNEQNITRLGTLLETMVQ
ncbi:MAG: SRPBCC family protein [Candidatus Gracilibacteria bacterium]